VTLDDYEKMIETRTRVFARSRGRCEVCGQAIVPWSFQLAHRIPQRKHFLKKYGEEVIHHEKNLAAVCSLKCNDAVSIAQRPKDIEALVEEILGGELCETH